MILEANCKEDTNHIKPNTRLKTLAAQLRSMSWKNAWSLSEMGLSDEPDFYFLSNKYTKEIFIDNVLRLDERRAGGELIPEEDARNPRVGLWELFWPSPPREEVRGHYAEVSFEGTVYGRDPGLDVAWGATIAIDFGNSGTVAARLGRNGHELVQIGRLAAPSDQLFENPTLMVFRDYASLANAWAFPGHQPLVTYEHLATAHTARGILTDARQHSDSALSYAFLSELKHLVWLQQQLPDHRVPLPMNDLGEGEGGVERFDLAPVEHRELLRGQPYPASPGPNLDPVELFAYVMGLTINRRDGNIYLQYVLTFPAEYPQTVRDILRASFYRGLLRSLPETINQSARRDDILKTFSVKELANEPAALALGAIKEHKLYPNPDPYAYGVFDFGGGTTDFDFGVVRQADPSKPDELDHEFMIERIRSGGAPGLGGERLVERLAYRVFHDNLDELEEERGGVRRWQIVFVRPPGEPGFPGEDLLTGRLGGRAARGNMHALGERLRPLWLRGAMPYGDTDGRIVAIDLKDRQGEPQHMKLEVDGPRCRRFLVEQVVQAAEGFLRMLADSLELARQHGAPDVNTVHIFLGGNASRSPMVQSCFEQLVAHLGQDAASQPFMDLDATNGTLKSDSETKSGVASKLFKTQSAKVAQPSVWPLGELLEAAHTRLASLRFPTIVLHPAVEPLATEPHRFTCKTGVALGLLHMLDGEFGVVDLVKAGSDVGRLAFHVGTISRGRFEPRLAQGTPCDNWVELGRLRQGQFRLVHSTSSRAMEPLPDNDHDLIHTLLTFSGAPAGLTVFAKPTSVNSIVVRAALDRATIDKDDPRQVFAPDQPFENNVVLQ